MTPEERAVIRAAERVVCSLGDDTPEERRTAAFDELERAVAAHDRVAKPYWWKADGEWEASDLGLFGRR